MWEFESRLFRGGVRLSEGEWQAKCQPSQTRLKVGWQFDCQTICER